MDFITNLFGKKDKKIQRQKTLKRNMIAGKLINGKILAEWN